MEEALRAYTAGGALALGVEDRAGTLEPGKRGDIVVLSDDPRSVSPEALTDVRIMRAYRGGQLAYERDGERDLAPSVGSTERRRGVLTDPSTGRPS